MMDNDFEIDLSEIKHVIETADVMLIRFPLMEKRLLLDARCDGEEGPLVKVVPRVNSVAERFRHLRKLRPRFPVPKNIVSFSWPKYVNSLETLGIWQAIEDRLRNTGYAESAEECREVFRELLVAERKEIISAVTGEGYHVIWERKKD